MNNTKKTVTNKDLSNDFDKFNMAIWFIKNCENNDQAKRVFGMALKMAMSGKKGKGGK